MGLGCVTCRWDWDVLPVDGTGMCYPCIRDWDALPVGGTRMCYP